MWAHSWIGSAYLGSSSAVIKNPTLLKALKVITWRWRLQLVIKAPFGLLWVGRQDQPSGSCL